MTVKSDAKLKEKLTFAFKYDMKNLLNFHSTTQCLFDELFFSKVFKLRATQIKRSYLSWHWTVIQNLNKPGPCGFKNAMRKWVNFHKSTQKSENMYFDRLFSFKAYNVLARKFHRNYVSWHWWVMQNLQENWLVTWKIK